MSNKPIVYLSGPIAGCSREEIHGWRNEWIAHWGEEFVRNPARRVWDQAYDNWDNYKEIIEADLDDIAESEVVLTKYDRPTNGTLMENVHGYMGAKLIVTVVENPEVYKNLSPWVIYHSDIIVRTFEDACTAIMYWMDNKLKFDDFVTLDTKSLKI
jgi:hypothetical protein